MGECDVSEMRKNDVLVRISEHAHKTGFCDICGKNTHVLIDGEWMCIDHAGFGEAHGNWLGRKPW